MVVSGLSRTWRHRLKRMRSAAAVVGVVWVVLGAGAGGAAAVKVFVLGAHPNAADVADIAQRTDNQRLAAGAFAANFVTAVLTTPQRQRQAALRHYMTETPVTAGSPSDDASAFTAPQPGAATVVDTARVWSVSSVGSAGQAALFSAIIVTRQRPYEAAGAWTAFYRVAVSIWRFQPRAMDWPAPISDPGPGADIDLAYDHPVDADSVVYTVVTGFVNTYLTSQDGLDRYVVADSWVTPIATYNSVRIVGVSSAIDIPEQPAPGQRVQVRAVVDAQTSQFATLRFALPLTLENVGGTWMVSTIDVIPRVAANQEVHPS